jgi:hypothetical protein
MADNKNQHFVPRIHLRPFTVNGDGLAINLFNLDRMKAIPNAPVRNQCSGDYFYGQNKLLENAINFIEDPYGPIVRHLSEGGTVNRRANGTPDRRAKGTPFQGWHDGRGTRLALRAA